jgi:hypothetical protein
MYNISKSVVVTELWSGVVKSFEAGVNFFHRFVQAVIIGDDRCLHFTVKMKTVCTVMII